VWTIAKFTNRNKNMWFIGVYFALYDIRLSSRRKSNYSSPKYDIKLHRISRDVHLLNDVCLPLNTTTGELYCFEKERPIKYIYSEFQNISRKAAATGMLSITAS